MTTGITWTEETWNPIVGCSIVSKGCTNCYAMQWAGQRMDGNPKSPHYAGTTKQVNGHHVWTGKLAQAPEVTLLKPLRWTRPRMIFVNSMSDLFHEAVPDEWIDQIFAVMALTPQHTYQILTKRPARMKAYMADEATRGRILDLALQMKELPHNWAWPLRNVWLGVSVEDQATADERIPLLLETPAAVRWISAEPLLGSVDLENLAFPKHWEKCECTDHPTTLNAFEASVYCEGCCECAESLDCGRLDWVVIGGESGRDARPMHPDWARQLRDQCADAEVPFFFKQWGEWTEDPRDHDVELPDGTYRVVHLPGMRFITPEGRLYPNFEEFALDDSAMSAYPVRRVGKKSAGDRLDGAQHHNWPKRAP